MYETNHLIYTIILYSFARPVNTIGWSSLRLLFPRHGTIFYRKKIPDVTYPKIDVNHHDGNKKKKKFETVMFSHELLA